MSKHEKIADCEHEELNKSLKTWNPMVEDYTNSKFNQYSSGPGADLGPDLQPGQLAKQQRQGQNKSLKTVQAVPYLVLKHVPKDMTKNAIYNICARHGRVVHVRDSNKNDYIFVDLVSVADMESVYRALSKNTFGFHVQVGKQYQKKESAMNGGKNLNFDEDLAPVMRPSNPDFQNRKYRTSDKNPTRPHQKQSPIVNAQKYNTKDSLLQRNDPHRHYLIEDDAHELERAGLVDPNETLHNKASKYKYRTGRAYIEMPETTKNIIEKKNRLSSGQYIAAEGKYQYQGKMQKPANIGKCIVCQSECDIICARCSAYFCGLECQRKAWPQHRFICGRAKFEQNLSSSSYNDSSQPISSANPSPAAKEVETMKQEVDMPPNGNLVTLTAISKPNVVFIRSKAYEDNLLYFKTISEIQAKAKTFKHLKEAPVCGQIVVAKFGEQYNRAMVLNADDPNCVKLVYLDYGNLDKQTLADLYEAPQYYSDLPRLALPVILKDVPDTYMSDKIRKFMYSYLDGIDLQVKYKSKEDFLADKGVYRVELIDGSSNQNFNKMIETLSKVTEPQDPEEVYFREYLTEKLLPAGDNIDLVVMDNSLLSTGCISCTTKEYALEIQKFQREIQQYGESLPKQNYCPRVNELCIAKYSADQKWYRGRCLDLVGDGNPTIVFFDYGNISLVSVNDIRRYPAQFTYPIYTADCEIAGLPEDCNENIVARLEELVPHGGTIQCDHIEVYEDNNFHSLQLEDVMQQLKSEGLLEEEETSLNEN